MDEPKRPMLEYQARAVQRVLHRPEWRELAIWFVGEPSAEDSDMVIRLPVGAGPALAMQIHGACVEMDKAVADVHVMAQPLLITGAAVLTAIDGHPALALSIGGFQLPVILKSDETARVLTTALKKAVREKRNPSRPKKLS